MSAATTGPSRSRRLSILTISLVFLLGVFAARLPGTLAAMGVKTDVLDPVRDVLQLVSREAVDEPDPAKLAQGAISGMLEALDDQYAEYIPAEDRKEFEKQMTGSFVGIGCQIEMRDGWLTVVSPLEDSPALNAGIIANDRIAKVEDKSTFGLTADECIKMLTGEPGTPVNLLVQRAGEEIRFTINRAKIVNKSVKGFRRTDEGSGHWDYLLDAKSKIGYIRLTQFIPTSPDEFRAGVESARRAAGGELNALIIDLRNNPGGVMNAALEIADMFLDEGVIMSIRGRDGIGESFDASPRGVRYTFPLAVLVNQNSASGSEIVAGALQDHDRAAVIGTRSFGKGLVQSVQPLRHDPGAYVKLTTQRYYLPKGRMIQRVDSATEWGVDPSPGFFVPMADKEQIDYLLLRRDWDVLSKDGKSLREDQQAMPAPTEQHWADPAWVAGVAKDKQLAAAVTAVGALNASGKWTPVSDAVEEHGKIALYELNALEKARERFGREFARLDKRIETLEKVAQTGTEPAEPPDLWADRIDVSGGRIDVFDKDGKRIAELRITGRDVERWLAMSDIEPVESDTASGPKPDGPSAEPKQ